MIRYTALLLCVEMYIFLHHCILSSLTYSVPFLSHLTPLRHPCLSRQQFRLSPGRQPTTLAQVPAGAHRDGRSSQLSCAHAPAPPQWPPRRPPPPPPQSRRRLDSLSAPCYSQPHQPVPLPSPRLPDRLQTTWTARHRAATECRCGPPLNTDYSRHPSIYPLPL